VELRRRLRITPYREKSGKARFSGLKRGSPPFIKQVRVDNLLFWFKYRFYEINKLRYELTIESYAGPESRLSDSKER
jgi:hypothetical protein